MIRMKGKETVYLKNCDGGSGGLRIVGEGGREGETYRHIDRDIWALPIGYNISDRKLHVPGIRFLLADFFHIPFSDHSHWYAIYRKEREGRCRRM